MTQQLRCDVNEADEAAELGFNNSVNYTTPRGVLVSLVSQWYPRPSVCGYRYHTENREEYISSRHAVHRALSGAPLQHEVAPTPRQPARPPRRCPPVTADALPCVRRAARRLHGHRRVRRSELSSFRGCWLEPPRRWLGAQWAGLFLGALSWPEPPGAR